MKGIFFWLLDRLRERSTWLGFISLIIAFGFALSPQQSEAIIALGLALAGAIGVFSKDKGDDVFAIFSQDKEKKKQ